MENVVAFNTELSGLYESKPPISKAKMAAITRAAMRAIKFYKHVVQSVEKFILKCKPEYKVPGLYVIDSIVRQSRHQYGPDKDVFAPRFARNMKDTFANLFRCAPEDKSRIIRVLNLWQKNNVFAPDVIQPIFDLADPNHPIYSMQPSGVTSSSAVPSGSTNVNIGDMSASQANGSLNTSGGSLDISLGGVGGGPQQDDKLPASSLADLSSASPHERTRNTNNVMRQLEHKQHNKRSNNNAPNMASTSKTRENSSKSTLESIKIHHPETYSKYQRSSHDYDYDDGGGHHMVDGDVSSDECGDSPKNSNNLLDNNNLKQLLNDPNVLRQLQTLQNFTKFKQDDKQHNLRMQEEAFEKHLQNVLKNSASGSGIQDGTDFNKEVEFVSEEQKIEVINLDGNDSRSPTPDRDRYKRRRSRSRSRSRDRGGRSRRGRSRSRSRSRSPRSNRRRTSRERERNNRDKERDREHERDRRKKGLPDIKKDHLSVCSTTLWVGHLSKLVYQEELSDTFGEYGDIVSIDQIVPRGCAFIVMNRRQDAYKAMQGLKNHKLQGRAITISWAAGKGVKSKEWKDFWDLELGVTYIPWSKLDESTDFDTLEEGGMFDEDSMPGWMKEKISKMKILKESASEQSKSASVSGISGHPPTLPPSGNPSLIFGIDTTQPPPGPPPSSGPPPILPIVPGQFSMAPPMAGPPRMLAPPHIGMPISGMHMPPNMLPPHAMMMMPGFGMGGPGGGPPMGPPHMPPMGGPHSTHPAQFPPPPGGPPVPAMPSNVTSDDQMDIEMEDEEAANLPSGNTQTGGSGTALNFSQPPPSFVGGSSGGTEKPAVVTVEPFSRDRNRGGSGAGSRWGGRGAGAGSDDDVNEGRWHENGGQPPQGGPHNYPDGGPRNASGPPHRADFLNDFEKRGGPGPRGPNFNGGSNDFHPGMQNRFNQPTNLMQMRIPPPNAFNQRAGPGGGPPMFMRGGQGGPGGGGGRQQGPGFFNRNNPFDRDINEGFGGRGRGRAGGRGGSRGGRGGVFGGGRDHMPVGGPHFGNWSDEEGDDGGFKRRGGNRFRDREGSADRFNVRDNNRGGRRGAGGPPRERNDSERDLRGGRDLPAGLGGGIDRHISRDDINKKKPRFCDTEEDWDRELEDYDGKNDRNDQIQALKTNEGLNSNAKNTVDNEKAANNEVNKSEMAETKECREDFDSISANVANTEILDDDDNGKYAKSTPLYDELPPPKTSVETTAINKSHCEAMVPPTAVQTALIESAENIKPVAIESSTDTPPQTVNQPLVNTSNKQQDSIMQSSSQEVSAVAAIDSISNDASTPNDVADITAEA